MGLIDGLAYGGYLFMNNKYRKSCQTPLSGVEKGVLVAGVVAGIHSIILPAFGIQTNFHTTLDFEFNEEIVKWEYGLAWGSQIYLTIKSMCNARK